MYSYIVARFFHLSRRAFDTVSTGENDNRRDEIGAAYAEQQRVMWEEFHRGEWVPMHARELA